MNSKKILHHLSLKNIAEEAAKEEEEAAKEEAAKNAARSLVETPPECDNKGTYQYSFIDMSLIY
jgi:hypothetical protein